MNQKVTIGNVCFIIDEKKQNILLLKRNKDPMKGLYTGVGGKTNFHEDIRSSCIREVKEETGLTLSSINLKGIAKTILEGKQYSWILFVYTANHFSGNLIKCDEGDISWVDISKLYDQNLIGFVRRILPYILTPSCFLETTLVHDHGGHVVEEIKFQSTLHTLEPTYIYVPSENCPQ